MDYLFCSRRTRDGFRATFLFPFQFFFSPCSDLFFFCRKHGNLTNPPFSAQKNRRPRGSQCPQKQRFLSARSGVRTLDTLIKRHSQRKTRDNFFHIGSSKPFAFSNNLFSKNPRRNPRPLATNKPFFSWTTFLSTNHFQRSGTGWIRKSPISRPLNAENSNEFSLRIQFSRTGKRVFGSFSSTVPAKKEQTT